MPELDAVLDCAGQGDRVGRHRHLRLQIEKGEEVAHEQRVLVQIAQAKEQRLKDVLAAAEDREIHRHRAQRDLAADGAEDDPRIGKVVRQRRQQAPAKRSEAALLRQRLIFAHELPEQIGVAAQQRLAQPEELHFLHAAIDREQIFEVVQLAGFGRAPRQQAKVQLRVLRLRDEGRDGRAEQNEREPDIEVSRIAPNEISVMMFCTM